jgi:hypothetical protein
VAGGAVVSSGQPELTLKASAAMATVIVRPIARIPAPPETLLLAAPGHGVIV